MRIISKLLLITSLFQGLTFITDVQAIPIRIKADGVFVVDPFARNFHGEYYGVMTGGSFGNTGYSRYSDALLMGRRYHGRSYVVRQNDTDVLDVTEPRKLGIDVVQAKQEVFEHAPEVRILRTIKLTGADLDRALAGQTLVINSETEHWSGEPVSPSFAYDVPLKIKTAKDVYVVKVADLGDDTERVLQVDDRSGQSGHKLVIYLLRLGGTWKISNRKITARFLDDKSRYVKPSAVGTLMIPEMKKAGLYVIHVTKGLAEIHRLINLTDEDGKQARAGKTLVIDTDTQHWE